MVGADSEAIDFRAASELVAPVRRLTRRDLRVLGLVGEHHSRRHRCAPGAYMEATMADQEDMQAELERLRKENETLKARSTRGVSLRVSEKGGVSVYGLGRFPVTLYKEQWEKLLAMADDIRAFLREHDGELKAKELR